MPAVPAPGDELAIFAHARHWKKYWSGIVSQYIHGDVLEVGAGIGSNVDLLLKTSQHWVCLEPDANLVQQLRAKMESDDRCEVVRGQLQDLDDSRQFDTILYIDVLEHIENDSAEVSEAASHLRSGGALIVLVPAHQWLFTPFDSAIGHFRRYDKAGLKACSPPALRLERLLYLDSVGLCASIGNKLVLGQSMPTYRQIMVWDKVMVPLSQWFDPISRYSLGKSLLAVWRKDPS